MVDYWQFHMLQSNIILIFNHKNTPTHTCSVPCLLPQPPIQASHFMARKQLFSNFEGQGLLENRLLVSNLRDSQYVWDGTRDIEFLTNTQVILLLLVQDLTLGTTGIQE